MARVTVQNLTQNMLSTDVGLLNPAESRTLEMGPDAAYRASEGLQSLVTLGYVSVTIAEEPRLLDDLEPAAVGTASVADGTVTAVKLGALAVETAKLDDLAVTAGKLGALAVETAKLDNLAVTAGKLGALAVETAKLDNLAVTTGKIALLAVDDTLLATGAVTNTKLGALAVTAAKIGMFVSTEQAGTGSPQNVAHGLSGTPTVVLIMCTDDASGTWVVTEGAHDGTNVIVTATNLAKFKVLAML